MSSKDIKQSCRDAVSDAFQVQANPTWLPPSLGGKGDVISNIKHDDTLDIPANMRRIGQEADPIGFLMAVMMGVPVPVFSVGEDGAVVSVQETATLKDRVSIAKFLGDRVVPKMSVNLDLDKPEDDPASFHSAVAAAARKHDG